MATIFILGLIALFVIIFAALGFKIVQQPETLVIERLGKYSRTLPTGINIIWPIIDRPREIMWRFVRQDVGVDGRNIVTTRSVTKIDLRETVYEFPKQNVIKKDNVGTEINAIIYFQITDPVRAIYEISNSKSEMYSKSTYCPLKMMESINMLLFSSKIISDTSF